MQMALIEIEAVSPTLIETEPVSLRLLSEAPALEREHNFWRDFWMTRIDTESALGKHALTSVLQDMLV